MKRTAQSSKGSTLMLALWALIVLSAAIFAWVEWIDRTIGVMNEANRGTEARALAHSGLAVAMHPNVGRKNRYLSAQFERSKSYQVTIESEGGRLNVNYLLSGADPQKIAFFKDYLASRGLNFQERQTFIDCLLDWISLSQGGHRLNAVAESPDYRPPHRPLQSLDEIALVAGSTPLISRADWKDDLTLYSSGPLDLESVSADWLALVPGIGDQRARRFVKIREKRLNQPDNKDGYPFRNLAEALSDLGLSQAQFSQLSGYLGFRDPVVRIESRGQSGKVVRQVDVIVRKAPGATTQILLWSEK
ncbi:MAG: hypothetical protein ACFUZC_15185 [Chthoniobacteraceae bacterium]